MLLRTTLFSLLGSVALLGCKQDKDLPKPNGLTGYWQLNRLECYCPANVPTPNEAVEFDAAGNVTFYVDGQVTQTGTYQLSTGSTDCVTNAKLMTFSWLNFTGFSPASYSIDNDQLIIDQGLCFDAPRKTYTFAPRRSSGSGK